MGGVIKIWQRHRRAQGVPVVGLHTGHVLNNRVDEEIRAELGDKPSKGKHDKDELGVGPSEALVPAVAAGNRGLRTRSTGNKQE